MQAFQVIETELENQVMVFKTQKFLRHRSLFPQSIMLESLQQIPFKKYFRRQCHRHVPAHTTTSKIPGATHFASNPLSVCCYSFIFRQLLAVGAAVKILVRLCHVV